MSGPLPPSSSKRGVNFPLLSACPACGASGQSGPRAIESSIFRRLPPAGPGKKGGLWRMPCRRGWHTYPEGFFVRRCCRPPFSCRRVDSRRMPPRRGGRLVQDCVDVWVPASGGPLTGGGRAGEYTVSCPPGHSATVGRGRGRGKTTFDQQNQPAWSTFPTDSRGPALPLLFRDWGN